MPSFPLPPIPLQKKEYSLYFLSISSSSTDHVKLQDLLNSGWEILRVDSPHVATADNQDVHGILVYVLYRYIV